MIVAKTSASVRLLIMFALSAMAAWPEVSAETVVHSGEVREFGGPDDLNLDPDRVVVAIDVFGDSDRTVNGVEFQTDKSPPAGVSVSASNSIDNWASRPSYTGEDAQSADNLEQIMQDIRWESAPNPVAVRVGGLQSGIEYELQMLFNEGGDRDRRWDIAIEGELAVDDFSSEGEGSWSAGNGFAYITPFTLGAGDTTLDVEMREHIGGQDPMGSDHNPILQAFTITELTVPPAPGALELEPAEFFAVQDTPVGSFTTTDLKRSANHLYSLADGASSADNEKFEIDDDTLAPFAGYDFTAHAPGTVFNVRVRTTDADDPARFLEATFALTLAAPVAPSAVELSATSISAGVIVATPVGKLSTQDANAVDAHDYSLVSGGGDDDNAMFVVDGEWLRLASPVPAGRDSVSLRIRSTDLSGLSVDAAITLDVTEPSLRINEVMASNGSTLEDEDGVAADWIELFNEQASTVNLNGWYLTDDADDLTKWQFPAVNIAANDFLVVFASGKDRRPTDGSPLHTNFQLGSAGETLALVEPDGVTVADLFEFPEQHVDVSYGYNGGGAELGFLQSPSPGAPNGDTAAQVSNTVSFSTPRGFYDSPFQLTLTASIPGSTIRYTTNGQKPSASSGSVYNGPIAVGPETGSSTRGTRRVRAIAIHPDAAVSPVATHTYVWVNGIGSPDSNGVIGQSGFRSSIKNHPTYGPLMDDGLLALPVVSIVKSGGVSGSEQETSIEFFSSDGSEEGVQIDCGIKVVGGASTGSPKNNFRCYFRSRYGASKLRYPLFANHPYTTGASEEFDVIQLRSGSHDNFYWMANPSNPPINFRHGDAQYVRNRWISDVEMLMGHTSLHGRFAHCYLNGTYHGLYHIHERPMHHYLDKYFGGEPEDYHYTNSARNGSDHGGGDSWADTWSQVKAAARAGGQESRDWINWENLADNQLLYYYCGNDWDWTTTHNWMAAGPKNPGEGGWRFYSWDCDVMLYDITANNLGQNAPDGVFASLMGDPDFRVFFRDRIYKHCFNDGLLRPGGLQESHDYRMNEIFDAIVPETARWQPGSATSLPWDRDGEWRAEWDYMRDVYWPRRTAILLDQLRARGWYPVEAPEFDPRGGEVPAGFSPAVESGVGTVYVTTDGSDPRLPGGAVNPNALPLDGASITETLVARESVWRYLDDGSDQGTAWRAPDFDGSAWASGVAELGYGDGTAGAEGTVISFGGNAGAKHITSYFRRDFEVGDAATINGLLMGLRRDDGAVVYLNGAEVWRSGMPAGAISASTLASNGSGGADETTFHQKVDIPPGALVEGTNTIAVEVHQTAQTSSDVSFDLELFATKPSDPSQFSIEQSTLVRARVRQGNEWSAINEMTFLVGAAADATNLVISEFSYRPSPPSAAEDPSGIYSRTDFEFVELTNISDEPVHLADLRFTEGIRFAFAGTAAVGLAPGDSVLVVENRDAFLARYPGVDPVAIAGEYEGNLSNDGEQIVLLGTGGSVVRDFTFNDKAPWPEAPDGDGFSLELIDPRSNPDHAIAHNWRASRGVHGTPMGELPSHSFSEWQELVFSELELTDPALSGADADFDFDGLSNFAEFALGTAPDDTISRTPLPEVGVAEIGGGFYLTLTYREWSGARGVNYEVEVSNDFGAWQGGAGRTVEVGAAVDNGDGTITRNFRSTRSLGETAREFIRLKMSDSG